jgi:hypothetical protein
MPNVAAYPLHAVRKLILHVQHLSTPNGAEPVPTPDVIYDMVEQLGCVQIDTLQMVERSQYITLWSRLGRYDTADFDRLIYDEPRRLFEDWMHAACILPLSDYRHVMPWHRRVREHPGKWFLEWSSDPANAALLDAVLERIRADGATAVGDFEYHGPKRGGWWDFKPAKHALEYRYAWGDIMIARRNNFARIYDLTERVLPAWVDKSEPTRSEQIRHMLDVGVRTFGACRPQQASDYYHALNSTEARPYLKEMLAEGVFVPFTCIMANGKAQDLVVHRDNLPLLRAAADGELPAQRTTFLSPFDNIWWCLHRDEAIWGYRKFIEMYVPAPKRIFGYFCMPILHHERFVGRFDVKLERKTRTLRLKALYLEPGVAPDDELVAGVATAMRDFLAFHDARNLVIERSDPPELGEKLLAALATDAGNGL